MAGKCLVACFWIVAVHFLCSARSQEFSVSVQENVAVGETIFSLSRLRGTRAGQKAELPCAKMEGDPYGRFNVTKNCTIVVATPLDWSVQPAYLLTIRSGAHKTSVKVELSDVEGYPPVYNKTCETPVNTYGKTGDFLYSITASGEGVTTTGDIYSVKRTLANVSDFKRPANWTPDPWMVHTDSDCNIRIASNSDNIDDLTFFRDLWDNGIRQITCTGDYEANNIVINVFDIKYGEKSRLFRFRNYVPESVVQSGNHFLVLFSWSFPTTEAKSYNCDIPPFRNPVTIRSSHVQLLMTNIEYLDMRIKPVGCPVGKYGLLCDKTCICKNGARCHGFNGACKCPPGWKGVACDIPKQDVSITTTPSDPRHIYISGSVKFHCKAHHVDVEHMSFKLPNATEKLSFNANEINFEVQNIQPTNNGPYTCQVRDTRGNTLNTTFVLNLTNCVPDRKGVWCDVVCDCLQGASCDRWAGHCVCPPGWTGTRCQTKCPHGTYGKDCARNCSCQNGATCGPVDDKCDCTDGWYGKDCSKPCMNGRFGWRCHKVCGCKNNATCNNVDGSCACVTPWTGQKCDQWQTRTDEPLLESLLPLGSLVLLVAIVMAILYKTGIMACSVPDTGEEDKILFELRRMEQDLAQSLQPGWLRRWEKKIHHLTPGPLIGEGMFGLVRKAQLRTPEGELAVAAKTVRVEDSQSYRDFYREAAILVAVHQQRDGDCRESNIVRLVGLITKSAEKYILLEYAPNGDLLGFLRRRIEDINEKALLGNLLGYAVHIARALQELDRLRIAHRDVAARNVLITADDVAKLADFGLARDVYATTQYVRCNRPGADELLPLKWMALESIENGEYTCQSDVWSFGVLLWEIATLGKDPCYDDGRMQLSFLQMVGILRQGKRMERPPGCPEDLYRLMRSCWRDVPDTRPTPEGIEERLVQLRRALLPHDVIEMETAVWISKPVPSPLGSIFYTKDTSEGKTMAGKCLVVGCWVVAVHFLCSARAQEFSVSVPENVAVGETIFSPSRLPGTRAGQKAELPCSKTEGDPYGRFNVTKNCTIVVANPLDWSVQPAYLLTIRSGVHNTSVKVELSDVEGYPPVYNDTCETPIKPKGETEDLLFRLQFSAEAVAESGEILRASVAYNTPDSWQAKPPDEWVLQTTNSDCNVLIALYNTDPDVQTPLQRMWDNSRSQLNCTSDSKLPHIVIDLYHLKREESKQRLESLKRYIPESVVNNRDLNIIITWSWSFLTTKTASYSCDDLQSIDILTTIGGNKLSVNFEYLDIQITPVGCPVGKYGFRCHKTCICKNGARCHGFNGACKCLPGWKGVACDIPKQDASITTTPSDPRDIYISANVTFHCKAHHVDVGYMSIILPNVTKKVSFGVNEIEFVVPNIQPTENGPYTCQVRDTRGNAPNTTFVLNVTNCAPDRKGAQCDEVCDCLQGASCDRWAGCVCPPGWTGTRCQTKCPHGTYGKNCARNCSCQNGDTCGPSDGDCNCTDGWYGKDCSKPCPNGRFGWRCQEVCGCKNNATCDNVDGSCACVTPWTGRHCGQLQTSTASTDEPLLESLVSLGSLVLLVAIVMAILCKTGILACSVPDTSEEDKILFELRRMEQDLAQSLQPGWLGRWEKKIRHLTPGPLIGEGMFGLVRKAQLRTPEGELAVAAKTVRVEDSQSYRDFYREAAILVAVHQQRDGDCRESNIVRLIGLITKSTEKYILLEYAPNGDLLGFLRRRIGDINEKALLGNLLGYAVHIARALQELERLRIAHRDVAARNVLITADDVAKLADFGLARDVYATTQYVRCNRPGADELLPLKWMALESIENGEYTCQSDVWSFGVLLWEIASQGKDPCYDVGRIQLDFLQMVGILKQGKRMERPPGCPEDLYGLMRSCWRDVPDTRPTPEGIEARLVQLRRALLPHDVIEMETVV
ncbi:uncharacterized protein [Branchiostoma lanceolatum]|uniref:uncharacterized protein n=1 Tax=Branchiostoma lanceolatum TaxID=7740 RepID=UPI00345499A4